MTTAQQKPRTAFRFAPRYGLRLLLLGMTVAGVMLGLDVKRAHERERLIQEVTALGGSYKTAVRRGIPVPLRRFLSHSQTHVVTEISLGGMVAHNEFGRTRDGNRLQPRDLHQFGNLLSMPGMSEVRSLKLAGTTVSDALIDDLAELHRLESVDFYQTAVTEQGAERLKQALADWKVTWAILCSVLSTRRRSFASHRSSTQSLASSFSKASTPQAPILVTAPSPETIALILVPADRPSRHSR